MLVFLLEIKCFDSFITCFEKASHLLALTFELMGSVEKRSESEAGVSAGLLGWNWLVILGTFSLRIPISIFSRKISLEDCPGT